MRVTVTQLNAHDLDNAWPRLVEHSQGESSQLVLLPEMPFATWLAATRDVDAAAWDAAVDAHESWIERLGELGAEVVVGTRPIVEEGERYNEAFVWTATGLTPWRRKTYLPDEPGFWESYGYHNYGDPWREQRYQGD